MAFEPENITSNIDTLTSELRQLLDKNLVRDLVFQTAPPVDRNRMSPDFKVWTPHPHDRNDTRIMNDRVVDKLRPLAPRLTILDGFWRFEVSDMYDGVHSNEMGQAAAHRFAWTHLWNTYQVQRFGGSNITTRVGAEDTWNKVCQICFVFLDYFQRKEIQFFKKLEHPPPDQFQL